jgi:hypothetical protein
MEQGGEDGDNHKVMKKSIQEVKKILIISNVFKCNPS